MPNSHGRFVWYDLMTSDVAAAKAFYTEVIGWGTEDRSVPGVAYTLFTAGEASVSGLLNLSDDVKKLGARPSWIGYVSVSDVDATTERIKYLGGVVLAPPNELPNVSRFSVVADPQLATLGLFKWLKPGKEQPADISALGHVGWHELLAADCEQVWAFYAELFGWQKAPADPGVMGAYQLFSVGGLTIGGMFTKPTTVSVPFWLYYFSVADIDAAGKRVKARGGQIISGPIEVPGGGWLVQCTDPQGAIFGLVGRRGPKGIAVYNRYRLMQAHVAVENARGASCHGSAQ